STIRESVARVLLHSLSQPLGAVYFCQSCYRNGTCRIPIIAMSSEQPSGIALSSPLNIRARRELLNPRGNAHDESETSPPRFSASGRGRCRSAGRIADREGASVSVAAGAVNRRLSRRRRD